MVSNLFRFILALVVFSGYTVFSTKGLEACTGIKLIADDGAIIHGRTLEFGVTVPTSAVGGGSDGGNKSGYSSGAGVDLVAKGTRRGGSGHRSGTTGDLSNDTVEERVLERKERRMLSNRESARRSRKRKQEHLSELEQQMAAVLAEKAEITARYAMVVAENKALRAELAGVNDGSLPTAFKRTKHELNNATAAAVSMSDDD